MSGTIISAYTRGNGYAQEIANLCASIDRLGVPYLVEAYDSQGSWVKNVAYKAAFMFQMREQIDGPMLWVDADAIVVSDPWPHLDGIGSDIAAHRLDGRELLSGTVYIADTDGARLLLGRWVMVCNGNAMETDQVSLDHALRLEADTVTFTDLPPELCWIDGGRQPDISEKIYGPRRPVIVHTQASRRLRKD